MNAHWSERASCKGELTDLFYPIDSNTNYARHLIKQAKAMCEECPVRLLCLQEALDTDDDFAIMGGLTAPERRRLKKKASA